MSQNISPIKFILALSIISSDAHNDYLLINEFIK